MEVTNLQNQQSPSSYQNAAVLDAAKALLTASGFSSSDVDVALEAISVAKEQSPAKDDEKYKFFLDRTIIYEDRDAFIFKRKRGFQTYCGW